MQKTDIPYLGYTILFKAGYYQIEGFERLYASLKLAKEAVDFIEEETMYLQ